jgi:hypothetical protein
MGMVFFMSAIGTLQLKGINFTTHVPTFSRNVFTQLHISISAIAIFFHHPQLFKEVLLHNCTYIRISERDCGSTD